jgi:effector-binding domain-containing protein
MATNGIERAGQPIAVTRARDEKHFLFSAAIPVTRTDMPAEGEVSWGVSPSGWAARAIHRGSYDALPVTYEKLAAWMAAHGHAEGRVSWEHYISDPGDTAVEDLVTHVYFQLESPPRG